MDSEVSTFSMYDITLFFGTVLAGILSGVGGHLTFDRLIDDIAPSKSVNLLMRYTVGVVIILPAHLLSRLAQHQQYAGKTPPIARMVGDYMISCISVSIGVLLPRLYRWWHDSMI